MDPEDFEQDLGVFFLSELAENEYPEGTIVDLIKKRSVKIARGERIDYIQFRGAFIYSAAVVRTILEDSVWTNVKDAPDIEGRMAVSGAPADLAPRERYLLLREFLTDKSGKRDGWGTTEYRHIENAIDKISLTLKLSPILASVPNSNRESDRYSALLDWPTTALTRRPDTSPEGDHHEHNRLHHAPLRTKHEKPLVGG